MPVRDKAFVIAQFRYAFLTYIAKLAPEVEQDLKELLPLYRTALARLRGPTLGLVLELVMINRPIIKGLIRERLKEHLDLHFFFDVPIAEQTRHLREIVRFIENFRGVIDRYSLHESWLREELFHYVGALRFDPGHPLWMQPLTIPDPFEGEILVFEYRCWRIGVEDRKEYIKFVKKAFDESLETYVSKTSADASLAGHKDARGNKHDLTRVKWLVRWTVQKWRKEDILEEIEYESEFARGNLSSIDKAFAQFKSFGLPVRESKTR